MAVDLVVSLWTYPCISGEVLDFLCHFYVHDKLTHASLWDTCHVICAYTQNLFDTFNHSVLFYPVMLLEINTKSNNPCFLILEICLWKSSLQISNKQSTAQLLFLLVQLLQCSSASSQKQHFGSIFELPVKWLLYLQACPFSSLACFCLLFSDLFWSNSFCCWTFKSRSRNFIRWCHVCLSLYSISQIVDSHLATWLSPIIWYILSNPSPLYNFCLILCYSNN